MPSTIRIAITSALLAAFCATATAQSVRLRGVIEKVDGNVLSLRSAGNAELRLALTETATGQSDAGRHQGRHLPWQRSDAAGGRQPALGRSTHFPGTDARYRRGPPAVCTHRGQHHDQWRKRRPGSRQCRRLDDRAQIQRWREKIVIPPNVPLVRYEISSRSDLKAGASFTVLAANKKADGSLETGRINVGRDGIVPQ